MFLFLIIITAPNMMSTSTTLTISPANVAMLVQGSELYGIGTIQQLYASGWSDMTFVSFGKGPIFDWLKESGAQVELIEGDRHYFASRNSLAMLAKLPAKWKQAKQDAAEVHRRLADREIHVVHTHRLAQQMVAGHMRPLGYKSVWQINNNSNPRRLLGMGRMLNHWLARWGADLLLPASDFIADNWKGCGVPMRTIRNAAAQVVEPRSAGSVPPVKCVVAGRLEASKGHHTAVAAVLEARQAGHDVELDIYGGPLEENPYAEELRQTIRDANAVDKIRFQGFCTDLRQRHGDYHLGFQCRIDPEPCSLWVCETMVDGLPILASATGGTPELVDNGVTGVLYPPGDSSALAGHLIALCDDLGRLDQMRAAAAQRGQQHFLLDRMLEETLEAYRSL